MSCWEILSDLALQVRVEAAPVPMPRLAATMSLIPAGTQTYSKARSQMPANAPAYAVSGSGVKVLCSDGLTYTDWTAALGPIVLGYGNREVDDAVVMAILNGPTFGLPTELEEQVAERLNRIIPCAKRIRFGKNGNDATSAAVRAARAVTGRGVVISQGYHGWAAEVGGGPNKTGVPAGIQNVVQEVSNWRDGDLYSFTSFPPEWVAAYIVEPDRCTNLKELRAVCDDIGAILIFDEVLTGFRLHLGGAQSYYGVTPDLACFSKAMGNGHSISAVVGSERAMAPFEGGIGYSMTFAGETTGLAAAAATIDFMERLPVIDHLWRIGLQLQHGWDAICKRLDLDFPCEGLPPRTVINWRDNMAAKTLVQQEMWSHGQMWTVGFTPTYAHNDGHVDEVLVAAERALGFLSAHRENLEEVIRGPIVRGVFRR